MNKLALLALAASAAFASTGAFAQVSSPGPVMGGSMPMPPAGTTFQGGGNMSGGTFVHGGQMTGGTFTHSFPTHIQRGFFIPPMWFGPQFQINNWQAYGFVAPPSGHRWVRYYDDAYLVDGSGRVVDTRSGLDWDQYGERWARQDGIPHYYGSGEFRPDERDHAWVQQYGGQGQAAYYGPPGYAQAGGQAPCGQPGCYQPMPQAQGCGGYAYGCGYYGYGYAYPIIIETTVTTGGSCCSSCCEEVIEEVVETRYVPRRPVRRAPPPPRPRPRPPAGERG